VVVQYVGFIYIEGLENAEQLVLVTAWGKPFDKKLPALEILILIVDLAAFLEWLDIDLGLGDGLTSLPSTTCFWLRTFWQEWSSLNSRKPNP